MILDKTFLLDLAGSWAQLKAAEAIYKSGAVVSSNYDAPVLKGIVTCEQVDYEGVLNLKSSILPQFTCSCGKKGSSRACIHILAICMHHEGIQKEAKKNEVQLIQHEIIEMPKLSVQHLKLSEDKGKGLSFKIYFPPNILESLKQDAAIVRFEAIIEGDIVIGLEKLDRSKAYKLDAAGFVIASLMEQWCHGKYYSLLQLSRDKLNVLLNLLEGAFVFYDLKTHNLLEDKFLALLRQGCTNHVSKNNLENAHFKRNEDNKGILKAQDIPAENLTPPQIEGSLKYLSLKLPDKKHQVYHTLLTLVKNEGFQLDPVTKRWWLRDPHKVLNFLAQYGQSGKIEWEAIYAEHFQEVINSVIFVDYEVSSMMDGEDYSIQLVLKANGLEEIALRDALAKGKYYIQTQDQVYLINPKVIQNLLAAQEALNGTPLGSCLSSYQKRIHRSTLVDVENIFDENEITFASPDDWKEKTQALRSMAALKPAPIREGLNQRLRGYQQMGVAWLWHLYQTQLGGILADEMGLGKTIQALALMETIQNESIDKLPMLVVCPAGLVENWKREAQLFTPNLKIFVHHRDDRLDNPDIFLNYDLIITSYSTLVRDIDLFQRVSFNIIIGDEAQHIKNRLTRPAKALRLLNAHARFLLTGTPLENAFDDIRSLFDFLLPGYLTRVPTAIKSDERMWYHDRLKQQVAPYILRRSKSQVLPELPDKIEQIIYCELEPTQYDLYQKVYQKTEAEVAQLAYAGVNAGHVHVAVLKQILRLRQVCVDPRLIDHSLSVEDSAKLKVLKELLAEIMDDGHRVLIFSQFVEALQLISETLKELNISYCYIDGQTKDRVGVCEKFNTDLTIPVCLISLKAGGVGLNLTGADTVIHYDPWWNPAVEAQATDRAHRIGQQKTVTSIKLITSHTIEEKVLTLQRVKAHLLKDLFEASDAANATMSLETMKALLDPEGF